ncbi:bifunctional riboflavin kinase/FAD synthetase [Gemella sp. GH3]|uniref:bifunctional riboflavin kinase/FAD synthetase n=1 Tax=unclassified Gemella TaxID=2624949 RepID=UPI0015D068BB|nr:MULTISPECIES: bifunctional riboflavin kinase/FAD synthetase [unclassified Gemella]MBF0713876.1 bifunctional riboflavin kinase/FAD synthetase [Gemella sp. GH3.1]NYS50828.1 bifunctional riboflavin kinase/FAD synthetase [Gemella sp. GH3]
MDFFKISNLKEINKDTKRRVAALGFFDGIHLAHKEIIVSTVNKARATNKISTLITFDKSPKEYFTKTKLNLITPEHIKLKILDELGIDEVYIIEFNDLFRKLTKEKFVDDVLVRLNVDDVYCGYDYSFGYQGQGSPEFIKEYTDYNINVNVIEKQLLNGEKISTTKIRELIKNGDLSSYYKFTGRPYKLSGEVVKGRQLGRTINFPTANINLVDNCVVPEKLGVYITKVKVLGKYYKGITNIGRNPTVSNLDKIFVETHILDFDKEIYGEFIELEFYKFIRSEKKFNNLDDLKLQLELDREIAYKENLENII